MSDVIFEDLETRIENLVRATRKLREENLFLREMVAELENERTEILEKQTQARARLEKVLEHLKALDASDELSQRNPTS